MVANFTFYFNKLFVSAQLNVYNYSYLILIIIFNTKYLFAKKCFQVFLSNANNSI